MRWNWLAEGDEIEQPCALEWEGGADLFHFSGEGKIADSRRCDLPVLDGGEHAAGGISEDSGTTWIAVAIRADSHRLLGDGGHVSLHWEDVEPLSCRGFDIALLGADDSGNCSVSLLLPLG